MRMLKKTLLTVSAVLSLVPMVALAYPPQCFEICNDTVACSESCAVGPRTWTTCGDYDPRLCSSFVASPTEPTASVTADGARRDDGASQVCSEEDQAAEQVATTES
jgi:hypothetical protein